jgi:hypothetical protein
MLTLGLFMELKAFAVGQASRRSLTPWLHQSLTPEIVLSVLASEEAGK